MRFDLAEMRERYRFAADRYDPLAPKLYALVRMMEQNPEKYPTVTEALAARLVEEYRSHKKSLALGGGGTLKQYEDWKKMAFIQFGMNYADFVEDEK